MEEGLVFIYFKDASSSAQIVSCQMTGTFVKDGFERMRNEAIVVCFKVLTLSELTEENCENRSLNITSWSSGMFLASSAASGKRECYRIYKARTVMGNTVVMERDYIIKRNEAAYTFRALLLGRK
jgi:hypothetical protein